MKRCRNNLNAAQYSSFKAALFLLVVYAVHHRRTSKREPVAPCNPPGGFKLFYRIFQEN